MTINRQAAVQGVYSTMSNKRKVVLDLLETILGSGGSVLNTSREKCSSRRFTSAAWSTLARAIRFGTMLLLLGCHVYAQINLSGAYRRAITFDHTKVANTDQTNFPVLIDFPNWAAGANSHGYDIIFTSDPAGQHRLDHEIDWYNGKAEEASFWVKIPTLSHTSDTTIYMFYGIPSITTSQENKAGVWSNGYLSVYHFGIGGLTDSASLGYTLAAIGGVAFNGDPGTYLYHDSVSAYPSGSSPVTLEAWARQAAPQSPSYGGAEILGYGENSANGSRIGLLLAPNNWGMEFENMGVIGSLSFDNNWHHFVGVYGGGALSTETDQLYLDGVPLSTIIVGGTPVITTTELKIGGIPTVTFCCAFNGSVDEVRVSSVARSADWVATEYANLSSPSTFYSVGGYTGGPGSSQGGGQGNLICSPSILYSGSNTTCSIALPSSATAQVTFSLDGQSNAIASPNNLGLFDALINLASASVGSHTVAFSYPGDGINPAQSGNTMVMVEAAGTTLPNESMVYQFSITQPDGSSGFAPNGNILGYFDSVNGMWSQIQYDGLNRLTSAQVTPPIMGMQASYFCWSFDSFGNRTGQTLSNQALSSNGTQPCQPASGATSSSSQMQYGSTNQIASGTWQSQQGAYVTGTPSYDANGSMTADLQNQYLYDAEGRVCAVQIPSAPSLPSQMVQYLYDAEGNRIGKGTITQWSCDSDNNGFSLTSEYVLDQGGEQVTELDGSPNGGKWIHTNAYAGGRLIATFDNLGPHYQLADWLGTRRVQVSPAGAVEETCQSLPFGDQLNCVQTSLATANDATEHHFTGKERDAESGLDYFGARYYASNMGRWISPDKPFADQHPENPQSWNLYSYVRNNPLSAVDPDGEAVQLVGSVQQRQAELEGLRASLVGSPQASRLYINPERDGNGVETGRYFLGINDPKSFAAAGSLESNLGELVGSSQIVDFTYDTNFHYDFHSLWGNFANATNPAVDSQGGAGTTDADRAAAGHITTTINPGGINAHLEEAPNPTLGETISHELAHALGKLKGLMGNRSNRMAVDAENEARARGGKERGKRETHPGGFPQ